MITSMHARQRMQQRGIPAQVVEWLLEYGTSRHLENSFVIRYLDKNTRAGFAADVGGGKLKLLNHCENAYVLVRCGVVVTVGHRYKRIRKGRRRRSKREMSARSESLIEQQEMSNKKGNSNGH